MSKMNLKDDDIILIRLGYRFGVGEISKIIDAAIERKDRDPLENYYLFVEELKRLKASC